MTVLRNDAEEAEIAMPAASNHLRFLLTVGKLKRLQRTGWVRSGVSHPESVSDHMYRMAMLAFLLPSSMGVDKNRCIRMALVHDLAEAEVGDITPHCGVSQAEKNRLENAAMERISALIEDSALRDEIRSLFAEYEEGVTPEAVAVHDLDKLEMVLQAWEYESSERRDLSPFFASTKDFFKSDFGRTLNAEIRFFRDNQIDANDATP